MNFCFVKSGRKILVDFHLVITSFDFVIRGSECYIYFVENSLVTNSNVFYVKLPNIGCVIFISSKNSLVTNHPTREVTLVPTSREKHARYDFQMYQASQGVIKR